MIKEEKQNQLTKLINTFKRKFMELTNSVPSIKVENHVEYNKLKLEDLEIVVNQFIPAELKSKCPNVINIKVKLRNRELTDLRAIFCFLAKVNGYNNDQIANYLEKDRTTIYNSLKMYYKLISYDQVFIANDTKIKKIIAKQYANGN